MTSSASPLEAQNDTQFTNKVERNEIFKRGKWGTLQDNNCIQFTNKILEMAVKDSVCIYKDGRKC